MDRRNTAGGDSGEVTWLSQAVAGRVTFFDQAETADGYVVLRWTTSQGGVGLAHSLHDGNGSVRAVVSALHRRHGSGLADRYACVVLAQSAPQTVHPYVPQLVAQDIVGGQGGQPDQYDTTWQQLAAVLGHPPPYWFAALRDRDAIASWRPGAPPAVVPACHVTNPVTALTELAADEPDGSPAAQLCWHLARQIRGRDHAAVTRHIGELHKNAADGGDGAHLVLGAVPTELRRAEDQELPEMVRRAGWLAITARRDQLAYRVADVAQRWGASRDWHTGASVTARPTVCQTAHEWTERLIGVDRSQAPTVLEKELLDPPSGREAEVLLHDPVTGVPALHRLGRPGDVHTYTLQRLPTHSRLAALILSDNACWIRTEDGTLWFAPEREDYGLGWGSSCTGSRTLAQLVERLLDDISAPAMEPHAPQPPQRLLELFRDAPRAGSTTYTRAQLRAACTG
ncbi:hypothetical protein EEJ42_01990 [Streptomyces botrytidirepellens]|uniref:Uncharacterized protein n=1 Tax=Streptomyces botrytidirepellens TaxID=2486417 RepID=A0A3M8X6L5_9ACTN|nr:hypothetical protein EEJ42_01990 [Streptomyces botrytidirepellens]